MERKKEEQREGKKKGYTFQEVNAVDELIKEGKLLSEIKENMIERFPLIESEKRIGEFMKMVKWMKYKENHTQEIGRK